MSDFDDDFDPIEDAEFGDVIDVDPEPIPTDSDAALDDEVEMLERALELARAKRDGEPKPNRAQRRSGKRSGITPPPTAPKPKDRKSKKTAQQDEAEDAEIVITAFGDEFRVLRSSLQNNWTFVAASAVGNVNAMLAAMLGNKQFVRFCQKAMTAGKRPNDAIAEMMDLISSEMGVGDSGNS